MIGALWLWACATVPVVPPAPPPPLLPPPMQRQTEWQTRALSSGLQVQLHHDDSHPLVELVVLGAELELPGLQRPLPGATHVAVASASTDEVLAALFDALAGSAAHPQHVTVLLHGDLDLVPTLFALEQRLGPWRPLGPVPDAPAATAPAPRTPARSGADLVLMRAREVLAKP